MNNNKNVNENNGERDATALPSSMAWNINTVDTTKIEALANSNPEDDDAMQDYIASMQEWTAANGITDADLLPDASVINPKRMQLVQTLCDELKQVLKSENTEFNIGLQSEAGSTHCSIVITVYALASLRKNSLKKFASVISQADFFSIEPSTIRDCFVITLDFKSVFVHIRR